MIRSYSELSQLKSFQERFRYLALKGTVGEPTFGFYRWMNQGFYTSAEWRSVRQKVILRDLGCDLGSANYEIHGRLYIHHMNPMTRQQLIGADYSILDPEFLITTTHDTHNAIHYGDEKLLRRPLAARAPGDTKLW